ncbi:MAG: FAD-binding protein [Polyangiaceae bacterium]|nr:FAD-binding protein [Polyangiaceae bacterium]
MHRSPIPQPDPSAREKARRLAERALGPSRVLTAEEDCQRFVRDESEAVGMLPEAVLLAESGDDIAAALAVASESAVPITPRGAGTGRTGGAVPIHGGLLLSVLGMSSIKEIDRREGVAVVEPGVKLVDLHRAVEKEGWFYPPDPNSLEDCVIAGNVAENAGGPRAFKYGVTRDYILGMEAFLIGGQRLRVGRRTIKGVTGYDLTGLLVGSEGTLAVFGDITLHLIPRPPELRTLLALFSNVHQAATAVADIVAAGTVPRCLELMDGGTLEAIRDAGNGIDERAGALLLVEVDGTEQQCLRDAERVGEACTGAGSLSVEFSRTEEERERLWAARRQMSPAVRRLTKYKLSEDVVVPRQRMPELLDRLAERGARTGVRSVAYGHAGDGNLHVNFLWNEPSERAAVDQAILQLFHDVVSMQGTLTGEHGIGVMKAPYLGIEQSPELIELEQTLKNVFDPRGLLNPGKIFVPPERRVR